MLNKIGTGSDTIKQKETGNKLIIPAIILSVYQILSVGNVGITNAQAANHKSKTVKNKINKEFQDKLKSEINFMDDIINKKIEVNKENQDKWIKSKKFLINSLYYVKKEVQKTIFIKIIKADNIMKIEYYF